MFIKFQQRGISLIELIMFMVIVSIAIAGILLVMNKITAHSADTLVRKQAIAIAESLLEEIELQDFNPAGGVATNAVTLANRATEYHIAGNYNGFMTTGIYSPTNTAIPGLAGYNLSVTVVPMALGTIPAADSLLITVTVTDTQGNANTAVGYRTNY